MINHNTVQFLEIVEEEKIVEILHTVKEQADQVNESVVEDSINKLKNSIYSTIDKVRTAAEQKK